MASQIFISYRRTGGDVTAKLICETLKVRGYTVFYDYDSLKGGYFDRRILEAIEGCNDFVLVLPPHGLDRCSDPDDWVRQEIRHALTCGKNINIIPVMLPGFEFPATLPYDIAEVARYNGVRFAMDFFEAVIDKIEEKLKSRRTHRQAPLPQYAPQESEGLEFAPIKNGTEYAVSGIGSCSDTQIVIPQNYCGKAVTEICGGAFCECSSLESIFISSNVSSIENEAIRSCPSLASICVSEDNAHFCSRDSILYTKDMRSLLFCPAARCDTSVSVPEGVEIIANSAFDSCEELEFISLPDSLKIIDDNAFFGCDSLGHINIPDHVTRIGEGAFNSCTALKSVSLPASIKSIGGTAFSRCSSLKLINYHGTKAQWADVFLSDPGFFTTTKKVKCANGTVKVEL